jgi:hypothetical protein
MRSIIKFCAGLFIMLGVLVFVGGVLVTVTAVSNGASGALDYVPMLGSVFAAASIVLVGGSTYLMCNIDERLERMASKLGASEARADVAAGQF